VIAFEPYRIYTFFPLRSTWWASISSRHVAKSDIAISLNRGGHNERIPMRKLVPQR
jgi:hypothetical protein